MKIFLRYKYLIAVLLGFTLGAAVVAGGIFTYHFFFPSKSANADVGTQTTLNSTLPVQIGPADIPGIVERVSNAVVFIETTVESRTAPDPFFDDPFFREFFGDAFRIPNRVSRGIGSGFIISPDGYILTNDHVIEGASEVNVTVKGFAKPFKATVVGKDFELDLAVLKINSETKLPSLTLGDSDKMRVGDWVIAIGNPYRLDHTVTVGVISAKGRPLSITDRSTGKTRVFKDLIQTDAAINPGNSGGPLISLSGEVIGINTAVNAEAQGIGFAIPINTAKEVLDELIKSGGVTRPYIGVYLQDITKDLADYFQLNSTDGALISYVLPGSPAEKAGLQQGDIILKVNDNPIKKSSDVSEIISKTKVGEKIVLVIYRNGRTLYVPVKVDKKPS
ncbi:S1C family serine protease [Thermosediminibacter oceani]|uniref:HtrA2 peptidase n=1 Tax=Thermosediminibacter oceani (strain ATCC BAA-1034 / DSM 16646 / JW/IW-1228P) TaxID=555079 RepID=D9RXP1_THEOJ|nr:trypsin-like peptidase domain-containing protein [Thermosediminibacter oceani]ADL08115.1 HtrA2 peptidase [Thermosediminibacter oceani DSM 16646]